MGPSFGPLIFQILEENGMRRKKKKIGQQPLFLIIKEARIVKPPSIVVTQTLEMSENQRSKKRNFFPKLNWDYIFRVELAGQGDFKIM